MTHSMEGLARIQRNRTTLHTPDYVQLDEAGRVLRVRCKLCGRQIYGERVGPVKTIHKDTQSGTVLLERRASLGPLPGYGVAEFTDADGGKHQTPICTSCQARGITAEQVEAIFHADLHQLHQEITASHGPETAARFVDRHVRRRFLRCHQVTLGTPAADVPPTEE